MTGISFRELVRTNRNFRLLWSGQVVSQLGDWFNSVAVYALLLDLTHSATAVAVMMVVQLLPSAVVGPYAGVLVDRLDRRRVMVAADLARGVLVLGLLLVRSAGTVWLAYAVIGAAVMATAFFEPARSAMLPAIASREELVPANALSSVTWSLMLAVGAALGGGVTALLGRNVAFVVNSASFFASAWFIVRIRPPAAPDAEAEARRRSLGTGFLDGMRYLRGNPQVAAILSVKAAWAVAGGVLLLLTVFGERVFPVAGSTAAGIGILYGARGLGSAVGSLVTRWLMGHDPATFRRVIAPAYLWVAIFYAALGVAPDIWTAGLAVVGAHAGGSVLWVASNVLLQIAVPDRLRGRMFAIDFALLTLVSAGASYATAVALDHWRFGPRQLCVALSLVFLAPAVTWFAATRRRPAGDG